LESGTIFQEDGIDEESKLKESEIAMEFEDRNVDDFNLIEN